MVQDSVGVGEARMTFEFKPALHPPKTKTAKRHPKSQATALTSKQASAGHKAVVGLRFLGALFRRLSQAQPSTPMSQHGGSNKEFAA